MTEYSLFWEWHLTEVYCTDGKFLQKKEQWYGIIWIIQNIVKRISTFLFLQMC